MPRCHISLDIRTTNRNTLNAFGKFWSPQTNSGRSSSVRLITSQSGLASSERAQYETFTVSAWLLWPFPCLQPHQPCTYPRLIWICTRLMAVKIMVYLLDASSTADSSVVAWEGTSERLLSPSRVLSWKSWNQDQDKREGCFDYCRFVRTQGPGVIMKHIVRRQHVWYRRRNTFNSQRAAMLISLAVFGYCGRCCKLLSRTVLWQYWIYRI